MRLILLLLITIPAVGQTDEIYRLTFSDSTNFRIMNSLGYKRPENIVILNSTQAWDYTIFWNKFVGGESAEQIERETKTSRHGDYDPEFLFRDPLMIKAINVNEKKALRKKTLKFQQKRLSLQGPNYRTVASAKNVKGFYVMTTEPVFSSDGRYAFMNLEVYFNNGVHHTCGWGDALGSTTIVYQKQANGRWKKFKEFGWLIL